MDKGGMSLSGKTTMVQSTILLALANFAIRGVSMAFQVYLTNAVGAAGLGLLQLILTVNGFALTLGTSGIRVAAMYLSAEEYGLGRPQGIRQAMLWCMGTGLILSTIVGLGLAAAAELLAANWVKDLQATDSLRLLGLTLPLTCASSILGGYFTACGKIGRLAIVEILDRLLSVFLTVGLLQFGIKGDLSHSCVSIIGGSAMSCALTVSVLLIMMLLDFRGLPPSSPSLDMGRRLRRFCMPVALNDYLRSGLGTLEQFLIPYGLTRCGGSRSSALADYGTIHGMVFPVMMFPVTVLLAVADLLVPRLARCRARQDTKGTTDLAERSLRYSTLFATAVGGLLYVLSDGLGILLYDSPQACRYLRLFAPLVPVLYLDCIVDGIHKGLGEQIYCVRVNTLTNLMDVVLLFLLLPRFGISGYYITYTATHVINFYLSLRRLMMLTKPTLSLGFSLTTVSCVFTVTAAARIFLSPTNSWRTVLLQGSIYLATLSLLLTLTGIFDRDHGFNKTFTKTSRKIPCIRP